MVLDQGVFEAYNYDAFVELLDDPSKQEAFIDFLVGEANKNAPELRALIHNIDAITRSIRLNGRGRVLPTLALKGQYNRIFNRYGVGSTPPAGFSFLDSNYNVRLSLSVPLINRNQSNINRQTAIVQKEQLELNKENTILAISANVRNGVLSLISQVANIELSKVSEATAKEALGLNQVAYSNGAVNFVQLLDAQNNYLNAQLASANATYNFLINSLRLERFLGNYFLLNSAEENQAFQQRFFEFLNNRN